MGLINLKEFFCENKTALKKVSKILLLIFLFLPVIMFFGKIFPAVIGWILSLLLIFGYYKFIAYCLKFCNVNFGEIFKAEFSKILLVSVISTIFIVTVFSCHKNIYFWDYLETWRPTIFCEETTFNDPLESIKALRHSINHSDYNNFLPMLMALPMHIFGKSLLCYGLYVWIMFGLPAIFFTSAFIKTELERCGYKVFPCAAIMALFIIIPGIIIPIFFGYANISILLPGTIIFMMLLNLDKSQLQLKRLVCLAWLSICAVFQARTAAYMVIGIFGGYTLNVIITSFFEKTLYRDLLILFKKFALIGLFAVLIMSPLFFSFLKNAITYDIGSAYSAYAAGHTFSEILYIAFSQIGFLIDFIFIIGIILGLLNKKLIGKSAFILFWAIIVPVMFCRIQFMGWQHFYIMILPLCIGLIALTAFIFSKKQIFGVLLISIFSFNFFNTYAHILNNDFKTAFNENYNLPVRNDIDELKKFVDYLNELTNNSQKKIYVLMSSGLYNIPIFQNIYFPEIDNATPNIMNGADVDLRDGFPIHFFDADFVVIADPIQTHLLPKDQLIVVKPAELIMQPSPIAEHFQLIHEENVFALPKAKVTLKVYEKIQPFEKSDIEFVEKIFVEAYPDKDELFKNRFEKYIQEKF